MWKRLNAQARAERGQEGGGLVKAKLPRGSLGIAGNLKPSP